MKIKILVAVTVVMSAGCAVPPPGPSPAAPAGRPPAPAAARLSPAVAASGSIADFGAALREAMLRHDLEALRPVMAADFSSGFVGPSNPEIAFAAWRSENFRSLDEAVALLEEGLEPDGDRLWVAPTAYRTTAGYRGLRLGARRGVDGRWEWVFLVRGEG